MSDPASRDTDPRPSRDPDDQSTLAGADSGGMAGAIGPYRLLEKIGEGGMGEVWLAEQLEPLKRRVALKVIKAGMDTKRVVARFEAERQALVLMEHPAIAKVFDAGSTPRGLPFFVMEHVPGVPINEYCDRHKLTNRERLALFIHVCEGVQHAHHKAIIHRDLKPSNVLVMVQDGKPFPKIIDFGVAKATAQRLTEKTMFTEMGALIGTPEYMSPEQAEMTGEGVDTRTDVYALGVILYELLVGALPFDSKELRRAGFEAIVRTIREEEPPKPSARLSTLGDRSATCAARRRVDVRTLRSQLRGDLDWITMKAIEKDRTRRYGSPAEFAADIRRHIDHEPVAAGPPSTVYRARKFVRRHRVGVSVAAAGLVVLVAFAATMAAQARRISAERETSDAVSEFLENMLADAEPEELGIALWKDLHERVAAARRKRGATQGEIDAAMASLDDALSGVNATDAALHLLDEQILARAGRTIERDLGAQPRIAGRLEHTLGSTYKKLGLYAPAEEHAKRAIALRAHELGPDHAETLGSMSSLAIVYVYEGRYAEAETLCREALENRRRSLGPDHPDAMSALHNLGWVYEKQGRLEEAEKIYAEAIERKRRVLGPDHLDTLSSIGNLALVYQGQGRYAEAESLFQETLDVLRRVLGPDHRDTLRTMNNLGIAYMGQRRYAEAEKVHEDTLEARRRVLGEDHPDTLRSMNNLANAYNRQGRHAEAEALHRATLETRRRLLGPEHPETLRSMSNLANVHLTTGRYDEAEKLQREALEIKRRVLGERHPNTVMSLYNLACLASRRGRRHDAIDWLSRAVEGGYNDLDQIMNDEDLNALKGDPLFEALVDRARANRPKTRRRRARHARDRSGIRTDQVLLCVRGR